MINKLAATLTSLLIACIPLALVCGYVMNIVALCQTDFKPSYRAETIRVVGVIIPVVGVVTGYCEIDDPAE